MIRLTLNTPRSHPDIRLFHKTTLLLGSDSAQVDVRLSGSEIEPIHLKIMHQNGFPILINVANDPFVLVNGHPFGKKLLNSGDVIVIRQTVILFENFHPSVNSFPADEWEGEELDKGGVPKTPSANLIDEPGADGELSKESSCLPVEHKLQPERKKMTSLKDDYLKELDDENGESHFVHPSEPSHLYQAWKWILLFIFSLITAAVVMGALIYFTVSDKTEAQETKMAQGVADVAISLAYAQLNHLKPDNQNWSDADFLKKNLQGLLPDRPSYASQIDAQGRFNCCPYSLRIYTSSDLSHFLVIAHPSPNLFYWLVPQSIIVVDSHLMELRTLKDVRSLNRLLANPDPLGGVNGKEIINLIKQGELIRLAALAEEPDHSDFAPPKNLAWIRPGAENVIYNAPRYYRLGHSLIQQAINLSTAKGSSQEVAHLKENIENFNWLHHFILYADQGKKTALLVRQGVSTYAPSDKLLFGYLLFNAQGTIYQAHLLKEEEEWKESSPLHLATESEGDIASLSSLDIAVKEESIKKEAEPSPIDPNHPIYIQLQTLMHARENELKPLMASLLSLASQELQRPRPQFQIEFQNLSHAYLMADARHKQALKKSLDALYHQYEEMPLPQFLAFVEELHLGSLMRQEEQSLTIVDENCQQNIETLLTQIESSKSLIELDNFMHIADTWLNLDYIKNPKELMKYQNLLRNQVLDELQKYLLTQKKECAIKPDDREILQDILSQERLIRPEEKEFFLEIFEELSWGVTNARSSCLS